MTWLFVAAILSVASADTEATSQWIPHHDVVFSLNSELSTSRVFAIKDCIVSQYGQSASAPNQRTYEVREGTASGPVPAEAGCLKAFIPHSVSGSVTVFRDKAYPFLGPANPGWSTVDLAGDFPKIIAVWKGGAAETAGIPVGASLLRVNRIPLRGKRLGNYITQVLGNSGFPLHVTYRTKEGTTRSKTIRLRPPEIRSNEENVGARCAYSRKPTDSVESLTWLPLQLEITQQGNGRYSISKIGEGSSASEAGLKVGLWVDIVEEIPISNLSTQYWGSYGCGINSRELHLSVTEQENSTRDVSVRTRSKRPELIPTWERPNIRVTLQQVVEFFQHLNKLNFEAFQHDLQSGVPPDVVDWNHETALMMVVSRTPWLFSRSTTAFSDALSPPELALNHKMIGLLVSHGADVNFVNEQFETPLLSIISTEDIEMTKFLVASGANIHYRSNEGTTPLMRAAAIGNPEIVQFLIEKGADPRAKDNSGLDAFDYANRCISYGKNPEVIHQLLRK